jgi:hypothetical protein
MTYTGWRRMAEDKKALGKLYRLFFFTPQIPQGLGERKWEMTRFIWPLF